MLRFKPHERSQTVHRLQDSTYEMLSQPVLPEFELHDATLDEALEKLNRLASGYHLPHQIRFERWTAAEIPEGFLKRLPGRDSKWNSEVLTAAQEESRISVKLLNIPLIEALRYVAGLSNRSLGEQTGTIYLVPGDGTFGPLVTREYKVSPGFPPPRIEPYFTSNPVREFLELQGMIFYEGTDAYVSPDNMLVVCNVQEQIDILDAITGCTLQPSLFEVAREWVLYYWEAIQTWIAAP